MECPQGCQGCDRIDHEARAMAETQRVGDALGVSLIDPGTHYWTDRCPFEMDWSELAEQWRELKRRVLGEGFAQWQQDQND